jgi:AraC-like DNA-binding protein
MVSNHVSVPLPPPWAQQFRSDDLDEVREFVGRMSDQLSRVPNGSGALGFEQFWVNGTSSMAGWLGSRLGMTVRGAVRQPVLHLAGPEGAEYRFGRRSQVTRPRTVTFLPPGWEFTRGRRAGNVLAIAVGEAQLAAEIEARDPGRRGELVLRARCVDLAEHAHARLIVATTDFALATGPGADPTERDRTEARLIVAVADLLLVESAAVRGLEIAASRLADVEAWIEAHLEEPISVGRLCVVAGVGERALQKAFEARRGMSPMRFVVERRLVAARRLLTRVDARDDVTDIAVKLGFGHVGRFASQYRQAFGESPSQSLRRAARKFAGRGDRPMTDFTSAGSLHFLPAFGVDSAVSRQG